MAEMLSSAVSMFARLTLDAGLVIVAKAAISEPSAVCAAVADAAFGCLQVFLVDTEEVDGVFEAVLHGAEL